MTEEKKPFTVSDRRHFTAEGEARQQVADEPTAPPKPPAAAPRPAEPSRSAPPPSPMPAGEPAAHAGEGEGAPNDFIGLLMSLATQASFLLSPEPGSGAPDLAGARAIIGLLEILREKTEGRRTPDEDRVFEGLLYELRMAFVARTRSEKA